MAIFSTLFLHQRGIMFSVALVCLFVSRITQKVMHWFGWNSVHLLEKTKRHLHTYFSSAKEVCFRLRWFVCQQDNSKSSALIWMKFCTLVGNDKRNKWLNFGAFLALAEVCTLWVLLVLYEMSQIDRFNSWQQIDL